MGVHEKPTLGVEGGRRGLTVEQLVVAAAARHGKAACSGGVARSAVAAGSAVAVAGLGSVGGLLGWLLQSAHPWR